MQGIGYTEKIGGPETTIKIAYVRKHQQNGNIMEILQKYLK